MSDVQPARSIWRMAARPLVMGVLLCAAAVALAGAAHWLAQSIAVEQGKAQAALNAANQSLENTQSDRARLEENLQMFDRLKQSRFAQAPDRLVMLEVLESSASGLGKRPLVWELGVQENIKSLNDDKSGEVVAQLVRVPMKLSASTIHEEEWLRLLGRLQGGGAGYFMPDSCVYEKKVIAGVGTSTSAVDVQCSLSWLYVAAEAAPKAP
jgi:hypothetical protein